MTHSYLKSFLEVSNLDALSKIEDKEAALKLSAKVNDAVQLLNDYNARLTSEMNERNKLTIMLKDFQREQQELLLQAEQRLEVSFKRFLSSMFSNACRLTGIHGKAAEDQGSRERSQESSGKLARHYKPT